MSTIDFRKPFSRPRPGEIDFSIVSYIKMPWLKKTRDKYSSLDFAENPVKETYIAQYLINLKIDLWLCVIIFEWKTKEITK